MKTLKTLTLFVIFSLFIGAVFTVHAQTEAIAIGDTVEGSYQGRDVTYTFDAEAGDVVLVDLVSEDFDPLIYVYDPDGETLGSDDDSGDGTNSQYILVAPFDGEYSIGVSSFSSSSSGSFVLSLNRVEVTALSMGESSESQMSGLSAFFSFEGSASQVVSIFANSDDLDTQLTLYSPVGLQIAYDDDSGQGLNPSLRRTILPADGLYVIKVGVFSESQGAFSIVVEESKLISLDKEPAQVTLDSEQDSEVFHFTAESGATYRLVVTVDSGSSAYLNVALYQGDFLVTSGSGSPTVRLALDFTVPEKGFVAVTLSNSTFDSNDLTISVEQVE